MILRMAYMHCLQICISLQRPICYVLLICVCYRGYCNTHQAPWGVQIGVCGKVGVRRSRRRLQFGVSKQGGLKLKAGVFRGSQTHQPRPSDRIVASLSMKGPLVTVSRRIVTLFRLSDLGSRPCNK